MIYEFALTIPANTPASAPATLGVPLSPGKILQVSVSFPSGCVGLVNTWATISSHHLWPTNLDETIKGDGVPITWPEDLDLTDAPYELALHAYNLDDTYAHTITWRFALIEASKIGAGERSRTLLERLARLFGI